MPGNQKSMGDPFAKTPLDWTYKGLPEAALGLTQDQFTALRLPLFGGDVLFPVAILHDRVLQSNNGWMMRFLASLGAELAPHGKTTMSPELMRMQMESGAWGLSAATVHHVRAYRKWGARRIILANQLVGEADIRWIAQEMIRDPDFDFYCLVDSPDTAGRLADRFTAYAPDCRLKLLVEVGITGGRTGVRSLEEGIAVAEAVAASPALSLCGVETFEGLFQTESDGLTRARQMLETVVALGEYCDGQGLFEPGPVLLSGGGSGLFDVAAKILSNCAFSKAVKVVVRSGCYIVHDDDMYRRLFDSIRQRTGENSGLEEGLQPALQVWGQVLSKPEPGRMICGLGKRDIGADCGLPVLTGWVPHGASRPQPFPSDCLVTGLNDQHAYVDGPSLPFEVGDLVGFGVSHPCTTFDKWRALFRVDDEYVITGLVRTYF